MYSEVCFRLLDDRRGLPMCLPTMFLTIVVLASLMVLPQTEAGCWETWSRCSGWSSWGTGTLWKSCNDRCKELGKSGGKCVLKDASDCWITDKAYQCVCN
ncbi:neuromacin-like protein isoform X2 [Haliotis rubra]|uniref:neuromacin-like protein isoform X2 n=1 Tax=Haliotis rubra TaxID=36100 RepID=UPI001EE62E07|nr:neuromacin-like protein isoform X2 [Haliotis rubra]